MNTYMAEQRKDFWSHVIRYRKNDRTVFGNLELRSNKKNAVSCDIEF